MKKLQIFINKPVHLGLAILEIGKIVIHVFRYQYVKPKYREKAKLFYMDTNSFIAYIKTEDIYADIGKDIGKVEARFYTFYELDRIRKI